MADEKKRTFDDPVDWDQLYPGRFLKAGEFLGKRPVYTISAVKLDELEGNTGKKVKGILHFSDCEKQLALNKTNGICLKAMFGKAVQDWRGKKVQFYAGYWNDEECIRVWGSPDIKEDFEVTVELPRKKPIKFTMHRTLTRAEAEAKRKADASGAAGGAPNNNPSGVSTDGE